MTKFQPGPIPIVIFGLGLISGIVYLLNLKLKSLIPGLLNLSDISFYICIAMLLNVLFFIGAILVFRHLHRIGRSKILAIMIIGFGVVFRAMLVPGEPALLSTDMYRYVWDGRVQQHGINPYLYAPSSKQLGSLRDDVVYPQINRKDYPTVYPAGAQLFFRMFHVLVGDSVPGFKGLLVFIDLMTLGLLVLTLRAYGLEEARVFIYAWNPLVIFEIGFGGHVDGLTVFGVVLACYLNSKKMKMPAIAALALSSATKVYPALFLPALLNRGERIKGTIAFATVILILYLPFFAVGEKIFGFLPNYFTSPYESFNLGLKYLIMDLFPAIDYFLMSKVFIFVLLTAGLFVFFREKENLQTLRYAYILTGLLIVFMPTAIHPWYMIMLVPFLCFFPSVAWLTFTGMLPLSYIYYAPSMGELPVWVSLLEYVPLLLILAGSLVLKRYVSRGPASWVFVEPAAK